MHALVLVAPLFGLAVRATNTSCYWKAGSTVEYQPSSKWYVCDNSEVAAKGASNCCYVGSECGQDGFCHFVDASPPGKAWFIGGCTDESWHNPLCPNACTQYSQTYAQYNSTDNLWTCCGEDICDGTNLTSETFSAVAPDQFSAISSIPPPSSAATSAAPATSSAVASHGHGHRLSAGAIAGIVVACVVVGLGVIGLIIFALVKRRRSRGDQETASSGPTELMGDSGPSRQLSGTTSESDSRMLSEADSGLVFEADSKSLRGANGRGWSQPGCELVDEKAEIAELPDEVKRD